MTVGSEVRTCYATIKSVEAELETLILQTTDQEAQQDLRRSMNMIKTIKEDLNQQLIYLINEEPQYK